MMMLGTMMIMTVYKSLLICVRLAVTLHGYLMAFAIRSAMFKHANMMAGIVKMMLTRQTSLPNVRTPDANRSTWQMGFATTNVTSLRVHLIEGTVTSHNRLSCHFSIQPVRVGAT
jgi:hypothetical protein